MACPVSRRDLSPGPLQPFRTPPWIDRPGRTPRAEPPAGARRVLTREQLLRHTDPHHPARQLVREDQDSRCREAIRASAQARRRNDRCGRAFQDRQEEARAETMRPPEQPPGAIARRPGPSAGGTTCLCRWQGLPDCRQTDREPLLAILGSWALSTCSGRSRVGRARELSAQIDAISRRASRLGIEPRGPVPTSRLPSRPEVLDSRAGAGAATPGRALPPVGADCGLGDLRLKARGGASPGRVNVEFFAVRPRRRPHRGRVRGGVR